MQEPRMNHDTALLESDRFQRLLDALTRRGFKTLGPTLRDGSIVYAELASAADLPLGWTDEQDGGNYRLKKRGDKAFFGFAVGPHSWKQYLHPPTVLLWHAQRAGGSFEVTPAEGQEIPRMAFLGVRPCELAAIGLQDTIFIGGAYHNPTYKARREKCFIVAVNCGDPSGTCFCVSMKTGPRAVAGFDLALTEVLEEGRHYFIVQAGSKPGTEILGELPCREASKEELDAAQRVTSEAAARMGRSLEISGLKELLYRSYEHPRWEATASRCLACANCTMVCPTCFCTTVEDVTDLAGDHAERWQKWDSCFTTDFSYIHGGSVRTTTKARYRQWMTHKLATWIDQFGNSGCVGCGRCITWCPVAIDITEEARAIRESAISVVARPER